MCKSKPRRSPRAPRVLVTHLPGVHFFPNIDTRIHVLLEIRYEAVTRQALDLKKLAKNSSPQKSRAANGCGSSSLSLSMWFMAVLWGRRTACCHGAASTLIILSTEMTAHFQKDWLACGGAVSHNKWLPGSLLIQGLSWISRFSLEELAGSGVKKGASRRHISQEEIRFISLLLSDLQLCWAVCWIFHCFSSSPLHSLINYFLGEAEYPATNALCANELHTEMLELNQELINRDYYSSPGPHKILNTALG